MKRLQLNEFQEIFGEELSPYIKNCINEYQFEYEEFSEAERNELLLLIVKTLLDPNITKSGEHRISEWEHGWGENLTEINKENGDESSIIPKYFSKYNAIRWRGRFIKPISSKFEYRSLRIILDWLFDKYARDCDAIYEFGCGPAHHLLRAREVNKNAKLWGLDWAKSSQRIIDKIRTSGMDSNIFGHNFDYFNPDLKFNLDQNSIVFTVASLEQIGNRWDKFINYLIDQKPKVCFHVEPIGEMLDEDVLLDYLSIQYFKKRNYLDGLLDGLRKFEEEGKVNILDIKRSHIGSLFIEGYSIVIWEPRI